MKTQSLSGQANTSLKSDTETIKNDGGSFDVLMFWLEQVVGEVSGWWHEGIVGGFSDLVLP
jgi:hypothetical protein